jgi:riboflavin kinase/FMN adenylyltransferase
VVAGPRTFRVFRGADGTVEALGATVVAFGKFDGVHRGHRALLDRALAAGRRLGLPVGAATFERHPYAHLRGSGVPPALTGLADRLRLLCSAGAAFVVLFPADETVLGLAPEDFARDILCDRMGVRLIVVGKNFRFGRGGAGDVGTLRRLVSVTGLDGVEIEMATVDGEVVSSSRIREHLAAGDVRRAGELLGRAYDVVGRTEGERPSTVVGVPAGRAVPASGRYRASVGPVRSGNGWADALVTVRAGGGGPHRLEVAELGGALGTRGGAVRVAFEDRG